MVVGRHHRGNYEKEGTSNVSRMVVERHHKSDHRFESVRTYAAASVLNLKRLSVITVELFEAMRIFFYYSQSRVIGA